MGKNNKTFRFLDLPAELRCTIYQYLLQGNCKIKIRVGYPEKRSRSRACAYIDANCKPDISAAIVFVNRQIYNEAIPILYNANTFSAKAPTIAFLVNSIGLSVQHLCRIEADGCSPTTFKRMAQVLRPAKRLTMLKIFVGYVPSIKELLPLFKGLKCHHDKLEGAQVKAVSDIISFETPRPAYWGQMYAFENEQARTKATEARIKSLLAKELGEKDDTSID